MIKKHFLLLLLISYFLTLNGSLLSNLFPLSSPTHAQEPKPLWPTYGLQINNTLGNSPQQNPKIVNNIIVWEDGRNGYFNLYAQKLDENGQPLWDKEGIAVAPSSGNQNFHDLVDDGQGGVIVVWQDFRKGDSDIYAQRISAQGKPLWDPKGVAICQQAAGQFAPAGTTDGDGGAIIVWHDYRSGMGEDLYAQRITKEGKIVWPENGVAVCDAPGTQWFPKIVSDQVGGAIVVWTDGREGAANNNIFGQRIDYAGRSLWEKNGIAICSASQNQENPVLCPYQEGVIVVWEDSRNGNLDLYAQKINKKGEKLWSSDGIPVTTAPFSQKNPSLAEDGEGGVILVWNDERFEIPSIYGQRITKDGQLAWGENGRTWDKSSFKQENPLILKTKCSEWIVIWNDYRRGFPALFAQKINNSGIPLWEEAVPLSQARGNQEKACASSLASQVIIAWQDLSSGNYDIYAQSISLTGKILWKEKGSLVCNAIGLVAHQKAVITHASQAEIILAFEDARSGYTNIYAQKVDGAGTLLWGKDGIAVAKVKAHQFNPQLVPDGKGGAFIIWEDQRYQGFTKIYAQRIGANGKRLWEKGSIPLTKINANQSMPKAIPDQAGGALVVWVDERDPLGLKDLYAQRISPTGELLWGKNGIAICTENGDQTNFSITSDEQGGLIITWTDYRSGERNPDIYAQKVSREGKLLWKEGGTLVCGAPDVQRDPQIISDGQGGAIIAWTDKGGGSYDIYAQHLNAQGQAQWLADGVPVCQLARTQQNPIFANRQIIIWEDYRFGNWDIFANALSPQGKLLWGEEGIAIVSLPQTQYALRATPWENGEAIVAWEDYRSGKNYEIYLQKITREGKSSWVPNGYLVKTLNGARNPQLLSQSSNRTLVVIWEDYAGGGKAIYGQRFSID